jgi:transposase
MARPFKLDIQESAQQLEAQLKTARTANQKERLQMLWWLKTGQLTQHQEIAARLGRDLSTITRWLQRYRHGGLASLLEVKVAPGQVPKIPPAVFVALKAKLNSERGFSSYGEIVTWLKTAHNVEVSYGTVYYWVHYRFKAKLKVPRPTSSQQDPVAVERFKKTLERRSLC